MAYRLTLFFTFLFLLLTVLFIGQDKYALFSYLSAFILCLSCLIYLLAVKKYKLVFAFYGVVGSALTHFAINYSLATPHYNDFLWLFVVSFLVFIGLGRFWGITTLAINGLLTFHFIFLVHNEHIREVQPLDFKFSLITFVELLVVFFVVGFIMYQFLLMQKHSDNQLRKANLELQEQNELILAKSNDNIALIKEIHHRVKNNLQIIISLLRLQQSEIKNQETKDQFTEAINRVMVMSSIHQRLYQEKDIARIELKSYLTDMATDLKLIFQNEKEIGVNIESSLKEIDLKTVVPLGLLLNELISNSYKYAFANQDKGMINIRINESVKIFQFTITIMGNGKNHQKVLLVLDWT
ncbi:MAG: sensor histidine kinase [Crocinitomicaceae bacterium]|nr:sensor histidine kinase [Crocinitomicaceae bacterium]